MPKAEQSDDRCRQSFGQTSGARGRKSYNSAAPELDMAAQRQTDSLNKFRGFPKVRLVNLRFFDWQDHVFVSCGQKRGADFVSEWRPGG